MLDLYIYSDESGTFDYRHNNFFIFGGLLLFGKEEKEEWSRKFSHAENCLRQKYGGDKELKGSFLHNKDKRKLYRSLNAAQKFVSLIYQPGLNKQIFENKRHKQRYLDFAYKLTVKKCIMSLIESKEIDANDIRAIHFYLDEHSTATDGIYELREGLLNEFKNGTFNYTYDKFYPPLLPKLSEVTVMFCDSKAKVLIRAADIISNISFYEARHSLLQYEREKLFIYRLP